jgi:hypothetical protein
MQRRENIVRLLRLIADLVEAGNPNDLESVLSILDARGSGSKSRKRRSHEPTDWTQLIGELRGLESREKGYAALQACKLSKRDLESLARSMDLHVAKSDNGEVLQARIVESAIGSRLSSEAIRGSNSERAKRTLSTDP